MDIARKPLLYGHWSTAVACMVAQGLGMGIFGIYGLFVLPLNQEMGIDVASLNLGLALMMVLMGVIGPILGPILDKTSIRSVMMIGAGMAWLGFWALSTASNALTLVVFYSLMVIGLGLYGPLTSNTLLVKNYQADRARALAIAAIGISLSSMVMPPLVAHLIDIQDWRFAMAAVGAICGLCVLAALWLLVPGGQQAPDVAGEHSEPVSEAGGAFLRQSPFWIIGLVFAAVFGAATLSTTSYIPHLQSIGYSGMEAALLLASGGGAGLVGKLSFAWFADRVRQRVVGLLLAMLGLQVLGWLLFINATEMVPLFMAQALLGFSAGICLPLQPFMNSLYFDARIIGKINGSQAPLFLPFGFILPFLAGRAYDLNGSYMQGFELALVIVVLALILALFLYRVPVQPLDSAAA